eukprot:SAG11_NODE_2251_length_3633_cov_15.438031_3_plen_81_part_00
MLLVMQTAVLAALTRRRRGATILLVGHSLGAWLALRAATEVKMQPVTRNMAPRDGPTGQLHLLCPFFDQAGGGSVRALVR